MRAHDYQALRDFSQNIIESINAGVLACNLEGTVEAWNSALERLYGLSRSEALGRTLEAVFPAGTQGRVVASFRPSSHPQFVQIPPAQRARTAP